MDKKEYTFQYEVYESIDQLSPEDIILLERARELTTQAYAPYSGFQVAAVARLVNGKIIGGSNQENGSFPAGLCAERVLLATSSSLYPGIAIETIAISYHNRKGTSDHPIFPCGICRQSLQEFERRVQHPLRLVLGGKSGKVCIIGEASWLLPFSFNGQELG